MIQTQTAVKMVNEVETKIFATFYCQISAKKRMTNFLMFFFLKFLSFDITKKKDELNSWNGKEPCVQRVLVKNEEHWSDCSPGIELKRKADCRKVPKHTIHGQNSQVPYPRIHQKVHQVLRIIARILSYLRSEDSNRPSFV